MHGQSDFSRDVETQSHWVSVWTHQVDIASNSSAPRALPWRQVRGGNKGEPRRERKKMSSDGGGLDALFLNMALRWL